MTDEKTPDGDCYLGQFACDCGQSPLIVPILVFKGESSSCGCYCREFGQDKLMIKKRREGIRKGTAKLNKSSTSKHRYIS